MATTVGNDYDHLDIAAGDDIHRHYLADREARNNISSLENFEDSVKKQAGINTNYFDKFEQLVISAANGTISVSTDQRYIAQREAISVFSGDTITFDNLPTDRVNMYVIFYASVTEDGGEFLTYSAVTGADREASVVVPFVGNPSRVRYFRFTIGFQTATDVATISPVECYVNKHQEILDAVFEYGVNANRFTCFENLSASAINGSVSYARNYIGQRTPIHVEESDTIVFENLPTTRNSILVVYYTDVTDDGGDILATHKYDANYYKDQNLSFTVPPGATYFRYCIGFGSDTVAGNIAPIGVYVNKTVDITAPLSVLVFGDSISDTADITIDNNDCTSSYVVRWPNNSYVKNGQTIRYQMWPTMLNHALRIKDLRDYAKSGAAFRTMTNPDDPRQKLKYQVEVALNDRNNPNNVFPFDYFNPNVIIVACGVNDAVTEGAVPEGAYDTTMAKTVMKVNNTGINISATMAAMDQTDTMDSMRWVFMKLKQEFPTALCLYVNPLQYSYQDDDRVLTAREEFRKMANRYGFINVDGFGESGIVRDFETQNEVGALLKDGLHPNELGQNLYTRMIVNAIRRYYMPLNGLN